MGATFGTTGPRREPLPCIMELTLYILAAVLVLIGLVGVVIPALPGIPVVYGGLLLAAWTGDFAQVGGWHLVGIAVLAALAMLIDFVAGTLGPKAAGASGWAVGGAAVGTILGLFAGIPGLLLGPFVGALLGELYASGDMQKATTASVGTWVGMALGTAANVALCFLMLGWYLLVWLW